MFESDFLIDLLLFGSCFLENRGKVHQEELNHFLVPKQIIWSIFFQDNVNPMFYKGG